MPLNAPETSLEIYKNIYITSCTQKTENAKATNMEKTFCGIVGGWYYGTESQRILCLTIWSYYFLIACFKTIILKNIFRRKQSF